jgi:hypothetical protein
VPNQAVQEQRAGRILDLDSPTRRQVVQLWVPELLGRGPYFMRLELAEPQGVSLAVADSDVFRGI